MAVAMSRAQRSERGSWAPRARRSPGVSFGHSVKNFFTRLFSGN
jgi:hypothetical protein